jgi:AcrR family transcriptional regulator
MAAETATRARTPRGQGRARLVAAAGELFAEQGVSGTSLQAIADRLGVTKAAVYHQFASKDEIVLAVAEPVIRRLEAIADFAASAAGTDARAVVIEGLVDLALAERGTAAVMRRDPTMAQLLDSHPPYLEQISRIDTMLLGVNPSVEQRVALAFAGGGIMALGALPGLDGPPEVVRVGLVAAMTRALTIKKDPS